MAIVRVDAIVKINGTDRTGTATTGVNMASLRIEEVANTRGASVKTCSFQVFDESGMSLAEEQTVVVQNAAGSTIWFNGFIASINRDQVWTARGNASIQCANYARYMEKCEELYDADQDADFTDETDTVVIHDVMDVCCPDIECTKFVEEVDDDLSMAFDYVTGREMVDQVCAKTGGIWYVDDGPVLAADVTNELSNSGFETAGAGGADVWADWTESAGDGAIANEVVIVHGGADAAKLTCGASNNTGINQSVTVKENWDYTLSLYTRTDGASTPGLYAIYDVTNGAYITNRTSTGVSGTTYTQMTADFTVPAGCTEVNIRLRPSATDGDIAYYDTMYVKRSYQVHLHYFLSPLDSAAELMANGGFETAGGGGADIWSGWTENAGDGALANEVGNVHAGVDAAKITTGAGNNTLIFQDITVKAGIDYRLSFYTEGDGSTEGRYVIYDLTNSANITALTGTGVPGTSYTLVEDEFTTPAGCVSIRIGFRAGATNADIAYFDAVSLLRDYDTSWDLLGPTTAAAGEYYTALKKITKAPEANRIHVLGAGTISRTVTSGARSDYGRWITKIHRDKSIKDNAEADAAGAALLAKYITTDSYTCTAYRWDANAGQVIGLTSTLYSLTDERLDIKRITTSFKGPQAGGASGEYMVACDYELGKFLPQLKDLLAESGRAAKRVPELEWEIDHLALTGSMATDQHSHGVAGITVATDTHSHGIDENNETDSWSYEAVTHCHSLFGNTGSPSSGDDHTHPLASGVGSPTPSDAYIGNTQNLMNNSAGSTNTDEHDHTLSGTVDADTHNHGLGTLAIEVATT